MIEGAAIGAEGGAVAGQQAAEDRPQRSVGVEPIEGRGRIGLVAGDAADPEPTGAVDAGVVAALLGHARQHLRTERARRFAPGVDQRATVLQAQDQPAIRPRRDAADRLVERSEEHTSELQSLMRTSYAVLCLKKKK